MEAILTDVFPRRVFVFLFSSAVCMRAVPDCRITTPASCFHPLPPRKIIRSVFSWAIVFVSSWSEPFLRSNKFCCKSSKPQEPNSGNLVHTQIYSFNTRILLLFSLFDKQRASVDVECTCVRVGFRLVCVCTLETKQEKFDECYSQ